MIFRIRGFVVQFNRIMGSKVSGTERALNEDKRIYMGKIMVVDDNIIMLGFMTTLLDLEGHVAVTVSRPEDILPVARTEQPEVILLDVHLAEQDTLSILQSLKSDPQLQSIPVIATSGMDLQEQCRALGADDFILKPFRPNQLLAKINALRQSHTAPPPSPTEHLVGAE